MLAFVYICFRMARIAQRNWFWLRFCQYGLLEKSDIVRYRNCYFGDFHPPVHLGSESRSERHGKSEFFRQCTLIQNMFLAKPVAIFEKSQSWCWCDRILHNPDRFRTFSRLSTSEILSWNIVHIVRHSDEFGMVDYRLTHANGRIQMFALRLHVKAD